MYSDTASAPDVLIGSTYFATHLPSTDYKPLYGVLWDMMGDRDLQVYQETYSVEGAPEVVQRVWTAAASLGYPKTFIAQPKYPMTDDQVPLLKHGLRVIDVVDGDYCDTGVDCEEGTRRNFHHTQQDTFDKVSARSLQIMGDVATSLVSR
jgi:glutaminyl-peptide cyclotransferase